MVSSCVCFSAHYFLFYCRNFLFRNFLPFILLVVQLKGISPKLLLIVHSTLCLCQFVEEETPKIVISIRHHKKLKIAAGGTKHHHQQWQQQRPLSKGHMAFTWAAILGPYGSFGSKGCSGCSPAFHALWQVQGKICQELGFPHLSVKAGWVFCAN